MRKEIEKRKKKGGKVKDKMIDGWSHKKKASGRQRDRQRERKRVKERG